MAGATVELMRHVDQGSTVVQVAEADKMPALSPVPHLLDAQEPHPVRHLLAEFRGVMCPREHETHRLFSGGQHSAGLRERVSAIYASLLPLLLIAGCRTSCTLRSRS